MLEEERMDRTKELRQRQAAAQETADGGASPGAPDRPRPPPPHLAPPQACRSALPGGPSSSCPHVSAPCDA